MRQYSIFQAKTHLSELLKYVKSGKTVTITERGKPIAQVTAIETKESFPDKLAKLKQEGIIKPSTKDHRSIKDQPHIEGKKDVLERFLRERDED